MSRNELFVRDSISQDVNPARAMNASNFGKEVKRAFPNARKDQITKNFKRYWVYEGLYLENETNVENINCTSCTSNS